MGIEVASAEYAQRVIDGHAKGMICSGEVWNQMIDHATVETLDDYMTRLTPELHVYLQRSVLMHAHARTEKERALLQLEWYEGRVV
jgi:hypothetical protein